MGLAEENIEINFEIIYEMGLCASSKKIYIRNC